MKKYLVGIIFGMLTIPAFASFGCNVKTECHFGKDCKRVQFFVLTEGKAVKNVLDNSFNIQMEILDFNTDKELLSVSVETESGFMEAQIDLKGISSSISKNGILISGNAEYDLFCKMH